MTAAPSPCPTLLTTELLGHRLSPQELLALSTTNFIAAVSAQLFINQLIKKP